MSKKTQKKKPGRKTGSRVTHGAYSLIARGEFLSKRCYIERWLSEVRADLISDLGPTEADLSTCQAILIDRIIGKLGILRCIEEHVREKGVMKGNELSPPLQKNYLRWANSLRPGLLALGISKKNGDRILSPLRSRPRSTGRKEAPRERRGLRRQQPAALGAPRRGDHRRMKARTRTKTSEEKRDDPAHEPRDGPRPFR